MMPTALVGGAARRTAARADGRARARKSAQRVLEHGYSKRYSKWYSNRGAQKGYSNIGTHKGYSKGLLEKKEELKRGTQTWYSKRVLKTGAQKGVRKRGFSMRVLKRGYSRILNGAEKLLRVLAAVFAGYRRAVHGSPGHPSVEFVRHGTVEYSQGTRRVLTGYSRGQWIGRSGVHHRLIRGPTARSAAHVCGPTACTLRWVSGIARRGTWLALLAGYSTGTPGPSTACTEAHPSASTAAAVWSQ